MLASLSPVSIGCPFPRELNYLKYQILAWVFPWVARRIGSHEAWTEEKRHGRIHQAPIAVAFSLLNVSCCLPCDLSYVRIAK